MIHIDIEWSSAAASDRLYPDMSGCQKSARSFIGIDIDDSNPTLQNRLQQAGKEVIAQSNRRDVTECENCKIKDFTIKELEDVGRNKDDKIEQLENEIKELTLDLENITDFYDSKFGRIDGNGNV
jgi:adenylate kinase family enzyme